MAIVNTEDKSAVEYLKQLENQAETYDAMALNAMAAQGSRPLSESSSYSTHTNALGSSIDKVMPQIGEAMSNHYAQKAAQLNNPEELAVAKAKYANDIMLSEKGLKILDEKQAERDDYKNSLWGSVPEMLKYILPPLMAGDVAHEQRQKEFDTQLGEIEASKKLADLGFEARSRAVTDTNIYADERADKLQSAIMAQRETESRSKSYSLPDNAKLLAGMGDSLRKLAGKKTAARAAVLKEGNYLPQQILAQSNKLKNDAISSIDGGRFSTDTELLAAQEINNVGAAQATEGNTIFAKQSYEQSNKLQTSIDSRVLANYPENWGVKNLLSRAENRGLYMPYDAEGAYQAFSGSSNRVPPMHIANLTETAIYRDAQLGYRQSVLKNFEALEEKLQNKLLTQYKDYLKATGQSTDKSGFSSGFDAISSGSPNRNKEALTMAVMSLLAGQGNNAKGTTGFFKLTKEEWDLINSLSDANRQAAADQIDMAFTKADYGRVIINAFDEFVSDTLRGTATDANMPQVNTLLNVADNVASTNPDAPYWLILQKTASTMMSKGTLSGKEAAFVSNFFQNPDALALQFNKQYTQEHFTSNILGVNALNAYMPEETRFRTTMNYIVDANRSVNGGY